MGSNETAFFKVGGSVFDELASRRNLDAVERAVTNVCNFHAAHPSFSVFVMPGGGPPGDILSAWHKPSDARTLSCSARYYLHGNAAALYGAFDGRAELLNPDDFDPTCIGRSTIKVLPFAPKQARDEQFVLDAWGEPIDLGRINKSDLQTLAAARLVGARKVVYIKHTDGIYSRDPNVHRLFRKSRRIEEISCHDLLVGETLLWIRGQWRRVRVSRVGADERDDHLCETIALRYMEQVGPEQIFITSWWEDWSTPGNPAERIYVTHNVQGISRIARAYSLASPRGPADWLRLYLMVTRDGCSHGVAE